MAGSYEAGHRETEKDIPRPLQAGWYPGTWALPAATLSAASLLVLVVIFTFLQISATSRALFRLPVSAGWPALAAAVTAWGIALGCRNRPGRHLPRWWVLFLAVAATGLVLVGFLGGDLRRSPLVHAAAVAALAASLTLTPRLIPLQPDRWLVQHIATLVLAAVLFVALPLSFAFGHYAIEEQKRRVADTIEELAREAGQVREISAFDWSSSQERRREALQQMQRLHDLPLEAWLPDRYLWEGAAILGRDQRLAAAYRDLLDAVAEGIDPAHTPNLWQPQFIWNHDAKQWERDPVFPALSAGVAGYHLRHGEILHLLAPPAGDNAIVKDLAAYYAQKRQEVAARLKAFSATWAEDWVPPLIEARDPQPEAAVSPLVDLLRKPLLEDGSLRPASLEKLLNLPFRQARGVAGSAHGCGPRPYDEDDFQYFRIDCYAYAPHLEPKDPGVNLRVEMRVVYKSEAVLEPLAAGDLPAEVFFLFPVPPDVKPAPYREDVMQAVESAVRSEHPEATDIKWIDRNIPSKGFSFAVRAGRRLRVVSSQIDDLNGGVPGIQVRAYYLDHDSQVAARSR